MRNVRQAIDMLKANSPFDVVCLDHDLGGEGGQRGTISTESCVQDGCRVARFITTLPPELRPKLVVSHSFNHAGRLEIVNILRDAGIQATVAPFTTFRVGGIESLVEKAK